MNNQHPDRRDFFKTAVAAGSAAFTANVFTSRLKGANDRITVAVIGVGRMGRANLGLARERSDMQVVAVCDVYRPNLDYAVQKTQGQAKPIKDFREIIADKSVDAVCVATPDHWRPYITIEACKAGKDVYVEKPISVTLEEGKKMVEAAREYNRRDFWLGPAPKRPYNANRLGIENVEKPQRWSTFRYFPEQRNGSPMMPEQSMKAVSQGNQRHWENFASCIRSRQKPVSDIEVCYKSTATCLLGNLAVRSRERLEFDAENQTVADARLKRWMSREDRKPWKLNA